MRTLDYSPLFRSTVGFDRLFDLIESGRPDWPPYNIEKWGENEYRITMAVAGFGPEEIELVQEGTTLTVSGAKQAGDDHSGREMLHQGLAFRNFRQTFNLAAHVKVEAASVENGLLRVKLVRELPEQLRPRRINLNSDPVALTSQRPTHN